MDVPKSKRGWKKGMEEKAYFCAAMDKKNSFLILRDSTELKYAQLCFDACEVAARVARQNLAARVDSAKIDFPAGKVNGVIYIWFQTCLTDGRMFKQMCMNDLIPMIQSRDEELYNAFIWEVYESIIDLAFGFWSIKSYKYSFVIELFLYSSKAQLLKLGSNALVIIFKSYDSPSEYSENSVNLKYVYNLLNIV